MSQDRVCRVCDAALEAGQGLDKRGISANLCPDCEERRTSKISAQRKKLFDYAYSQCRRSADWMPPAPKLEWTPDLLLQTYHELVPRGAGNPPTGSDNSGEIHSAVFHLIPRGEPIGVIGHIIQIIGNQHEFSRRTPIESWLKRLALWKHPGREAHRERLYYESIRWAFHMWLRGISNQYLSDLETELEASASLLGRLLINTPLWNSLADESSVETISDDVERAYRDVTEDISLFLHATSIGGNQGSEKEVTEILVEWLTCRSIPAAEYDLKGIARTGTILTQVLFLDDFFYV